MVKWFAILLRIRPLHPCNDEACWNDPQEPSNDIVEKLDELAGFVNLQHDSDCHGQQSINGQQDDERYGAEEFSRSLVHFKPCFGRAGCFALVTALHRRIAVTSPLSL